MRERLAAQAKLESQQWEQQQRDRKIAEDAAYERALFADHLYEITHGVPRPGALEQGIRADERPERYLSAPPGSPANPVVLY